MDSFVGLMEVACEFWIEGFCLSLHHFSVILGLLKER